MSRKRDPQGNALKKAGSLKRKAFKKWKNTHKYPCVFLLLIDACIAQNIFIANLIMEHQKQMKNTDKYPCVYDESVRVHYENGKH